MNLSLYISVAFLLLGLELLPYAIAQAPRKNVTELPVREEDLPEEIVDISSKDIFKFNGTEIVSREGNSPNKCRIACEAEKKLDCRYYRYITTKEMCLLFSSKLEITGQSRAALEKEDETEDEIEDETEDENDSPPEEDLAQEVQELEKSQKVTNSTLNEIANKVDAVDANSAMINEKVSQAISNEKETAKELNSIEKKEEKIESEVKDLVSTLEKLGSDVVGVKVSNDKIRDDLEHSETKSPVLDRQLKSIKRQVADLKSKIEMNPTVFKITKNQRVLAEALESIDRELTIFERKLGHIDDVTDEMGGRLTKEELHRKTLNGALQTLTAAVRTIRRDIDRIENPLSELNVKRDNIAKAIKSDVNVLIKNNKKLNHDTRKIKTELNNLLKDLLVVQQGNQEGKTSIAALSETNKNMRQDFTQIRQDQEHMMSKIQTLATVYRSVLTALHNMEIKQIQVVHRINQYEQSLHRLSNDFLGKKMQSGSGSSKTPMMSSNLTSYSNLLLSQRNLYSQLLSLRNEVRALKGDAPTGGGASTTTLSPTTTTLAELIKPTVKRGRLNLAKRLKSVHKLNTEIKNKEEDDRRKMYENPGKEEYLKTYRPKPPRIEHVSLNADALRNIAQDTGLQKILESDDGKDKKYNVQFSGHKAVVAEDNTPNK